MCDSLRFSWAVKEAFLERESARLQSELNRAQDAWKIQDDKLHQVNEALKNMQDTMEILREKKIY